LLRRTALHRTSPEAGGPAAPPDLPQAEEDAHSQDDQGEQQHQPRQPEAPAEPESDQDGPELGAEIPMPSAEPLEPPGAEAAGRVLGRTRTAAQVPSHLQPYRDTIVIGGDPRRAAPSPPQLEAPGAGMGPAPGMDQAMAAAPPAPPAPAIDKEIIARAEMQAQQMLEQAQQHCQQMVNDAQAQLQAQFQQAGEQGQQQGYQQGFEQGVAAGQEQGMQETLARVEQLKVEFIELVMARRKVLAAMEPEIVHLAVNIAEKIVGMELSAGREIITGIVRQALATLKERDEIVIRVNPSEVEAIQANQTEYEAMIEGLKRFEVIPDGAIEAGSCSIETSLGNVDARINTQLEAVRAGLDEMCKIRAFEMKEKLESEPVEVPGDPEFHARILQAEAEARAAEAAAKAHH
jgi:flagellar assembly protein FliH